MGSAKLHLINDLASWLQDRGFSEYHRSDSGSVYMCGTVAGEELKIRIADHHLPWTDERQHSRKNGVGNYDLDFVCHVPKMVEMHKAAFLEEIEIRLEN